MIRIATRMLSQLRINRHLQIRIRDGLCSPVQIGQWVYTYCSAGYYVRIPAVDWLDSGCSATLLAA